MEPKGKLIAVGAENGKVGEKISDKADNQQTVSPYYRYATSICSPSTRRPWNALFLTYRLTRRTDSSRFALSTSPQFACLGFELPCRKRKWQMLYAKFKQSPDLGQAAGRLCPVQVQP